MYCKFCGKQITEDAQFCSYCGGNLNGAKRISVHINMDSLLSGIQGFIEKADLNRLIALTTTVFLGLSFLVRFTMQEVVTVLNFLASDDYYVISNAGRVWIVLFMITQTAMLFLFRFLGIKKEQPLKKNTYIYPVIALLTEIFLLLVKIPAPY